MPSFKDIYRTPLLSAQRLGKEKIQGPIESIAIETVKGTKGEEQTKLVVEMSNGDVRIALNKGNAQLLAKKWGDDYEKWVGKVVKVATHKTQYMGKEVDGLLLEPVGK